MKSLIIVFVGGGPDFAMGSLANLTNPAVNMFADSHFIGRDLPKLECGSTRAIFLEAMMSFDDFNVGAARYIFECSGCLLNEFHRQINCDAHIRCIAYWYDFGRVSDRFDLFIR